MSAPMPPSRFLGVSIDDDARGSVGRLLVDTVVPDRPTRIHALTTPEGVLGIATCGGCGGRHEHLLDCRARSTHQEAATAALWEVLTHWVMGHECPAATLPESILDAADAEVERAVPTLAQRGRRHPDAVLVMPRGGPIALHLPELSGLPDSHLDETYAWIAHELRQTQLQQSSKAVGLVVLRLVPPPFLGQLPYLSVTCASRERAVVGRVPVQLRDGAGPSRGGEWTWEPVTGPHRRIDGVLAEAVEGGRHR